MGIIPSVVDHTLDAGWRVVANTMRGAMNGEVDDIARIAVVAGMATGSIPVSTGTVALAGDATIGSLVDVFA